MRILYLEDNALQAEQMVEEFERSLGLAASDILLVTTEADFVGNLEKLALFCPAVAVLDVMVPWSDPGSDVPQCPDEVQDDGGYFCAGIRCAQKLRNKLPHVPIIFYTVVSEAELKSQLKSRRIATECIAIIPKGPQLHVILDQIRTFSNPKSVPSV